MHSTSAFPSSLTPSSHRLFARLLAASALFLASICQSISTAGQPAPLWDVFVQTFIEDYFAANPTFAVYQGRHDFDGRLPDWSETGIRSDITQLKGHRTAALAFAAERLTKDQAFERDHLVAFIDSELFWLETADWPHVNPAHYAWALDPDVYVSREYAPLAQRLEAYTRYARAVPAALTQVKTNLRGPLAQPMIANGRITIGGLAEFFENEVPKIFADALRADEARAVDFAAANREAILAVQGFSAWLDERAKTAAPTFALGPEKFRAMIRETEGVDISLAELEAIGRRDLERNLAALRQACTEFAPGKSIRAAVELAGSHKSAGSVVAGATQQLAELRQFILQHDIVTIPGPEEARVAEPPPYRRNNLGFINIPGPYERGLPSIYYIAPPDPTWSKEKQDAYVPGVGNLLYTSVHEVWPGHFLHFLHSNRAPSKFSQVFVGYAFSEGWAHYAEEMMWEMGLGAGSPELRIGQLTWALLRDVRLLAAIGLHSKGMSVDEATKFFLEQGYVDPGNAEQQARRGVFDPAFLNYTMGKLMIRKLRDDWCATRGGRAAWKQFHDELMRFGGPPIPLVRRAMLGPDDRGSLF